MIDIYTRKMYNIQKENNILKQNAAAAARAPVKPVSGGGDVTPTKEDPWLKGFDMERW